MIFVPTFAGTWVETFPKASSLLEGLMVSTAVFFFDGIVIFAFYAKLNTRLAGLLTFVLLLVTGLLTLLLSHFSTGYLRPKRPYALSLIIFVLIVFSGLVLYGLYAVFGQTIDLTQGLGVLTALFAVITGLVGTYFGVKASSDATEAAQKLAAGGTTLPIVSTVNPPDGGQAIAPRPPVTATFSKAMALSTITRDTFRLVPLGEPLGEVSRPLVQGAPVQSSVTYDPPSMAATLNPLVDLGPGLYRATITTGVKDMEGNALASEHTWQFTVNPPEPPPNGEPQPPGRAKVSPDVPSTEKEPPTTEDSKQTGGGKP